MPSTYLPFFNKEKDEAERKAREKAIMDQRNLAVAILIIDAVIVIAANLSPEFMSNPVVGVTTDAVAMLLFAAGIATFVTAED